MKKKDTLDELLKCLKKREEILIKKRPISMYNKYFDKMIKYARLLIEENRQNEILSFLESESISIRFDSACLLYNFYPEKCRKTLEEIGNMSVPQGLPKSFVFLSRAAHSNLKYGIPKNFP